MILDKIKVLCLVMGLMLSGAILRAEGYYGLPDSLSTRAQMSILVASPSPMEVYTLYGHAGYRVQDSVQGIDVTFNYGIFDFSDDFLPRFIKGQTDYIVVAQRTQDYMDEYLHRGSQVTELVLNLSPQVQANAWRYLLWNVQPENRTYRYNFFYDNCATRLVQICADAIRQTDRIAPIEGTGEMLRQVHRLQLPGAEVEQNIDVDADRPWKYIPRVGINVGVNKYSLSWRDLINELEGEFPWLVLGTDLALGMPTDEKMADAERIFLPHLLQEALEQSSYLEYHERLSDGVVESREVLVEQEAGIIAHVNTYGEHAPLESRPWESYLTHPIVIFGLLALLSLYIFIREGGRWLVILIFALSGLGGSLLFYIAVLSEHPHVWPNFNLWVLHPLHLLIAVPLMLLGKKSRWAYRYHFANFVAQAMFLVLAWSLPQTFNVAVYLLSLSLLLLSLSQIKRSRMQPDESHLQ
ncbi:MAG: DUF4105 domain-containing protein [Porphyromonadaceae bacterium]|nr:DUF4105 domain-containing protein [Porphyromonadaceae bacterium]